MEGIGFRNNSRFGKDQFLPSKKLADYIRNLKGDPQSKDNPTVARLLAATIARDDVEMNLLDKSSHSPILYRALTLNKPTNQQAALIQVTGKSEHHGGEACRRCKDGLGPFKLCVTGSDPLVGKGACANCVYNGNSSRCSFRQGEEATASNKRKHSDLESEESESQPVAPSSEEQASDDDSRASHQQSRKRTGASLGLNVTADATFNPRAPLGRSEVSPTRNMTSSYQQFAPTSPLPAPGPDSTPAIKAALEDTPEYVSDDAPEDTSTEDLYEDTSEDIYEDTSEDIYGATPKATPARAFKATRAPAPEAASAFASEATPKLTLGRTFGAITVLTPAARAAATAVPKPFRATSVAAPKASPITVAKTAPTPSLQAAVPTAVPKPVRAASSTAPQAAPIQVLKTAPALPFHAAPTAVSKPAAAPAATGSNSSAMAPSTSTPHHGATDYGQVATHHGRIASFHRGQAATHPGQHPTSLGSNWDIKRLRIQIDFHRAQATAHTEAADQAQEELSRIMDECLQRDPDAPLQGSLRVKGPQFKRDLHRFTARRHQEEANKAQEEFDAKIDEIVNGGA